MSCHGQYKLLMKIHLIRSLKFCKIVTKIEINQNLFFLFLLFRIKNNLITRFELTGNVIFFFTFKLKEQREFLISKRTSAQKK
ncbi:hypothetical protein BpHYR1_051890 [Brachionus plicatilis]|uniref:Uncharacterized protein n=1 Tax=Brachionus plicatilis TaxID=10195 RepID=A0A3M7RMB9_BRAPC|nr:hypothetical protein BpHYR1_051890 [Brachionus plicatilis]